MPLFPNSAISLGLSAHFNSSPTSHILFYINLVLVTNCSFSTMPAILAAPHGEEPAYSRLTPRFNPFAKVFGWVPEPYINTRGTYGLLQSCVITTFFCVATSLHLNIPKAGQSTVHRAMTRSCWIIANTLAPEIMLTVAMTQYLESRILLRDINELC